jgi:hypothetical protein
MKLRERVRAKQGHLSTEHLQKQQQQQREEKKQLKQQQREEDQRRQEEQEQAHANTNGHVEDADAMDVVAPEKITEPVVEAQTVQDDIIKQLQTETDPEELMLYGTSAAVAKSVRRRNYKKRKLNESFASADGDENEGAHADDHGMMDADFIPKEEEILRPTFCGVCRIDGSMEVYSLPEFELVWRTVGVNIGKHVLRYEAPAAEAFEQPAPSNHVPPVQLTFDDDPEADGDYFDASTSSR